MGATTMEWLIFDLGDKDARFKVSCQRPFTLRIVEHFGDNRVLRRFEAGL